jgi:hypothetical protein
MNHEPDDFGSLLENSLQTYANAEPRPGLQERILTRTSAQLSAPALSSQRTVGPQALGWFAAAAAACAILVAVVGHPHHGPASNVSMRTPPPSIPPAVAVSDTPKLVHMARQQPPHRPALPRAKATSLEATSQERLLAGFVVAHAKEALMLAKEQAQEQARLDQPIAPTPITIRPLQIQPIPSKPIVIDPIQVSSMQTGR